MTNKILRSALTLSVLSAMVSLTHANEVPAETVDESVVKMETIVVSASGSQVNVKDAPASISVVTSEDLKRKPFSNLAEVLSDLPGVTGGFKNSGSGSKITFRGMPDKYTLILVDGKRVGNQSLLGHRPDRVDQDLNWITPDMIERIEVIRGSMSTLYGSEAVGGVINIITKKVPSQLSGSVNLDYTKPDTSTRGNTVTYGATLAGPLTDTLGFRFGVNRTDREGDNSTTGTSGAINDTVNGRLTWAPNDTHTFNIDASWGKEEPDVVEGGADQFAYEMERQGFGIGYAGTFKNELKTYADLYYNEIENKDEFATSKANIGDTKATEAVLDLKATKPLQIAGFKNDLTVGAQYKYEEVSNASNIGNINVDVDTGETLTADLSPNAYSWSLFAEDQIHLQENLILTLGGRLDQYDDFDLNFSPRGYLVYHPTNIWTVKGGVSRSFRAPNLKERSATSSTGSRGNGCKVFSDWGGASAGHVCNMLGNPDLEPETSTNYEVGFGYAEGGYAVDMTYFRSDINDLMQNLRYARYGNQFYTMQQNVEKARTSGIEVTYKFPLSDVVRMSGNATYMIESKNLETGATLLATPELTLNGALYWDVTDKLNLHTNVQYLGKQALQAADSSATYAKAYTTMDVGANYEVNDYLTFRSGVKNIGGVSIDAGGDGTSNPAEYYLGFTARF
ncbi:MULTISPECIES: TonB-dependent receptor domain-containing protein [unclassified Acinetobacter]|uniref:TonB-dependent receptor domain-containing protein n=1 Tax=Acinetobacter TaxID=469 RepID=UPI0015D43F2A|nr:MULTISPECIES: TonB-dependent receptor [unclassified Acinetobacter]